MKQEDLEKEIAKNEELIKLHKENKKSVRFQIILCIATLAYVVADMFTDLFVWNWNIIICFLLMYLIEEVKMHRNETKINHISQQ